MKNWFTIAEELGLASKNEASHHPHCPEERAELFHAADGGSTEFEYLTLLHALVLATKPLSVIETGTYNGFGTLAIASALAFNGTGRLITLDVGECADARMIASRYAVADVVDFVRSESVQYCATCGSTFDFAFFDSDVSVRHRECEVLLARRKLARNALVVFHDASELRYGVPTSYEMIQYMKSLPGGVTLPFSRGLRIWQA